MKSKITKKFTAWLALALCLLVGAVTLVGCVKGDTSTDDPPTSNPVADANTLPVLVDRALSDTEVQELYETVGTHLSVDENSRLKVSQNGKITYSKWAADSDGDPAYTLSDDEAVAVAEQTLEKLGLLPTDNYRTAVSKVQQANVNVDSADMSAPKTIEYTVCFYRTYNGMDILSDEDDGILITLNKDGVSRLTYLWRNMQTAKNPHAASTKLTAQQAQAVYEQVMTDANSAAQIAPIITAAYLQTDGETRAVWAFSSDVGYVNSVFVDMYTGEVME